jgi:GTPase
MAERLGRAPRAVLVGIDFGKPGFSESLDELGQLSRSAGYLPCGFIRGKRIRPDSSLFAGSGKVGEIRDAVVEFCADAVIFNHALSPAQERNLQNALEVRVIDRTRLILDIFGKRARSHEGKLQVELAQLQHASTRLVRGWTHLERQRGGRGFLGGMGETQLEVDRRLLVSRMRSLKSRLDKLKLQRNVQRRSRDKSGTPTVSLVGYTNAGKSSVFNSLTHADAYAADQLFATLDTTSRRTFLESSGSIVVSDTVGFIQDLPHTLIEAFRATLEEATRSDLLLHVVDSSSAVRERQIEEVDAVLREIGAAEIPRLILWNKIDLLTKPANRDPGFDRDEYGKIARVRMSAKTEAGLNFLRGALDELLAPGS